MTTKMTSSVSALSLALLAALFSGCEDSGVIAPSDGSIVLTANPSAVIVDPGGSPPEGSTTITAVVFDKGGTPQQNITLLFSTSAGKIVSAADGTTEVQSAKTNSSGIALVKLVVSESDPDSITVTASSSILVKEITVTKSIFNACAGNAAPVAVILGLDSRTQQADAFGSATVPLDGTGSSDDNNSIVDYVWICGNGVSAVEIGDGSTATCKYQLIGTTARSFTASLNVKDECQHVSAADSVTITIQP